MNATKPNPLNQNSSSSNADTQSKKTGLNPQVAINQVLAGRQTQTSTTPNLSSNSQSLSTNPTPTPTQSTTSNENEKLNRASTSQTQFGTQPQAQANNQTTPTTSATNLDTNNHQPSHAQSLTFPTRGSGIAAIKQPPHPPAPKLPPKLELNQTSSKLNPNTTTITSNATVGPPPPPIINPHTPNNNDDSKDTGNPPAKKNRLNLKLVAGALIMLIVVAGVSVAYYLNGQSQDVRQQAYGGQAPTATPTPRIGFTSEGVDIWCGKKCDENYAPCAYSDPYNQNNEKYMCWNGICQLTVCRGESCQCDAEKKDEEPTKSYYKWDEATSECIPAFPYEKPSYKDKDKCEAAYNGNLEPVCSDIKIDPPEPGLKTVATFSCFGTNNMLTTIDIATPADRGDGFSAFSRLLNESSDASAANYTFYKTGTHKIRCTLTNPQNKDKTCSIEKLVTIPTPAEIIPPECGNPCPANTANYEACVPGEPASKYMCWNGICQAAVCRGQDCMCDINATPNEYWVWDQTLNNGNGGCKKTGPSTPKSFRIKENCEYAGADGVLENPACQVVNVWPQPTYKGTSTISCMGTPNASYQILVNHKTPEQSDWSNQWQEIYNGQNSSTTYSFDQPGDYKFKCRIYFETEEAE